MLLRNYIECRTISEIVKINIYIKYPRRQKKKKEPTTHGISKQSPSIQVLTVCMTLVIEREQQFVYDMVISGRDNSFDIVYIYNKRKNNYLDRIIDNLKMITKISMKYMIINQLNTD